MSAVPPLSPDSLPGPEIDPSPAPAEAPASPEPPYPPAPAENPALPIDTPAEVPAPSPVEVPAAPMAPPAQPPVAALLAALVLAAAGLGSQRVEAQQQPAARTAPLTAADRRFMDEATASGMVEIVLGRLAQEKAAGEPARHLGQQMVEDHNKANEALKALAAAKGVPLPTGLTPEDKANAARMKKIRGAAFDKQYLARMVADHQKAVALFTRAAGSASDPDVKAFAQAQLPTMSHHLQMARDASAVPVAAPKRGTAARE